ncbi:hypothetical protein D3C75_1112650 [compost metagenome]
MHRNITLEPRRFKPGKVDQYQAINAVVEGRIGAEINKLHPAGFTQLGILFIQRRYRTADVAQQAFQPHQIFLIVIAGKLCQYLRQRSRIRLARLRQGMIR